MTNKAVPARIRESLNAESGLNDGICVPILFVFLALATGSTGELLAMGTWVIFGAAVIGQSWGNMSWEIVLYSVLSLTLIRMLPVVLSLRRTEEPPESKLFLAWFGPRGLASIVFLIIVAAEKLPNTSLLINVVVCTVTLSVIAHGVTANPLSRAFSAKMKRYESDAAARV